MIFDDFQHFYHLAAPSGHDDSAPATKTREMLNMLFKRFKTHRKRAFPAGRNFPDHPGWPTRRGWVSQFHEISENHENNDFL